MYQMTVNIVSGCFAISCSRSDEHRSSLAVIWLPVKSPLTDLNYVHTLARFYLSYNCVSLVSSKLSLVFNVWGWSHLYLEQYAIRLAQDLGKGIDNDIKLKRSISLPYDHRLWRIRHPVRSAIYKPQIGRLVIGCVITRLSALSGWVPGNFPPHPRPTTS
jgi:hypothetical protein